MIRILTTLFLTPRFFYLLGAVVVLFAVGYQWPVFYSLGWVVLVLLFVGAIADAVFLFFRFYPVTVERKQRKICSLDAPHTVELLLKNTSEFKLYLKIIDELPVQLEVRDFIQELTLESNSSHVFKYDFIPKTRGEYQFGVVRTYIHSSLGLVERMLITGQEDLIAVYPSIDESKRFEQLVAGKQLVQDAGIKKIRRLGHSYEFEQIKNYIQGDDFRTINWKASSRRAQLMVNQYEDERTQQIYCIIDKGRTMRLPFNNMTLLDYAINTALVISNTSLKKYDRAGLLTFSDKFGSFIKADRKTSQIQLILKTLYKEKERDFEPNFELLYQSVRRLIHGRSMLMLFTNFESHHALERTMPLLRRINRFHLLVVVIFENTEISEFMNAPAESHLDLYQKTIARQVIYDKKQMVKRLEQYGIQCIYTRPELLTTNALNKYMELKARRLI